MTEYHTLIARWQSRGGKYWLELHEWPDGEGGFYVRYETGRGNLGNITREEAMRLMQLRIADYKADRIVLQRVIVEGKP